MALPKAVQKQADKATAIQNQLAGVEPTVEPDEDNPAPASDQVDWEKRFKGMQKTHDKTVRELRDNNDESNRQIGELKALLEKATAQPAEPAVQAPIFTEAEVEEYGQDFLDMVTRVAEAKAKDSSSVTSELEELKGRFDNIVEIAVKSDEQKFYTALDKAVPDWEDINDDDDFHAWLAEEMPMTGRERQVFLTEAQRKFDAKTVISFFTAWKGRSGEVSHYPDTTTTPSQLPGDHGDEEGVIISKASVKQFYTDAAAGRYKGKDELKAQIEAKIFRATQEGRVR